MVLAYDPNRGRGGYANDLWHRLEIERGENITEISEAEYAAQVKVLMSRRREQAQVKPHAEESRE